MSGDLLQTKLHVPRLRPLLVPRPRLSQRLNQGVQPGHKLILISAPAGFGKTTLVSEWLVSCRQPTAWLSLDAGDNDPTRFLAYLVAALQTIVPAIGDRALAALQSRQLPPLEAILTTLLNEIDAIPHSFLLVLDDYHLIDAQAVDAALAFLLEYLPAKMQLVIVTREDPPLPLSRYRIRGQLSELRATDLRFTAAEAASFLNQGMGLGLTAAEVAALETRTEGWIAGLQLAALSLQGREDHSAFIAAFAGDNRYIVDYLVEEVLQSQPEPIRRFLLQTSILDRLSAPLCDAVTGQKGGQGLLLTLERGNLFVVPLDDRRRWYRYHHLFADVLRAYALEEQPESVSVLHRRASAWYAQQGLSAEAIRHALSAGEFEQAADLAELAWPANSGSYQSIAWLGRLAALPDELVRARPVLCVAYAWALLNSGNLEAAAARLEAAERWLERTAVATEQGKDPPTTMIVVDEAQFRSLPASVATARAYHAQACSDIPGTVKYAQRVLDLVPEAGSQWRGDATALLGLAQWASGELETAHRIFSTGLADMAPLDMIVGTFVLVDIKMALGHLREAMKACADALAFAGEQGEPMPLGTEDVYIGMSKLHREQGDLEAAAQDLLMGKELGEQVELPDWQYRWCRAQARLSESLGDLEGALNFLDEAKRLYVRTPLPEVQPVAALKTRIWVTQNRLTEAFVWVREQNLSAADDLSYLREFEHITLARVLIARQADDPAAGSIHEALGLLKRLLQAAEAGGRAGSVIEILVLQAVALEAQGNITVALAPLERALILAEPEGYCRIFVDEGPTLAPLLYEALAQGISPAFVQWLLAAFPDRAVEQAASAKKHSTNFEWIEPLSEREIEVLQLISEGLTNKAIAARLYLSLHTVKVHAHNIYAKLGVKNRTEAVARGNALGILSSAQLPE